MPRNKAPSSRHHHEPIGEVWVDVREPTPLSDPLSATAPRSLRDPPLCFAGRSAIEMTPFARLACSVPAPAGRPQVDKRRALVRMRNMRTRTDKEPHDVGFDLQQSLGFLVAQLAKKMTAQFNARLAGHGLTTTQWGVLACLWGEDGLTQHEVSSRAGIDAPTLTEMLQRMTARGLVRRERDPDNNRYQRVYLISHDPALRDTIAGLAAGVNDRALAGFSATDRAQLTALLQRALANLDTTQGDQP